jgi:hypothetical protein
MRDHKREVETDTGVARPQTNTSRVDVAGINGTDCKGVMLRQAALLIRSPCG